MGTYAGPAGMVGTGVGTGLDAYGQAQGLKAMRNVWRGQDQAQAQYDAQLRAKTDELIRGINPQAMMGTEAAQARTAQMDGAAKNLVQSAQRQAGARTGGSRGGAESRAQVAQAQQGTLANALAGNRLAGILAGLQQGGAGMDMLGRRYALDAGNIRGDARRWAGLADMQEKAAGMTGGWARQIGGLFNTLGQGAMMYGMAQPKTQQAISGPDGGLRGMQIYDDAMAGNAPAFDPLAYLNAGR